MLGTAKKDLVVREAVPLDSAEVDNVKQGARVVFTGKLESTFIDGQTHQRAQIVDPSGWVTLHVQLIEVQASGETRPRKVPKVVKASMQRCTNWPVKFDAVCVKFDDLEAAQPVESLKPARLSIVGSKSAPADPVWKWFEDMGMYYSTQQFSFIDEGGSFFIYDPALLALVEISPNDTPSDAAAYQPVAEGRRVPAVTSKQTTAATRCQSAARGHRARNHVKEKTLGCKTHKLTREGRRDFGFTCVVKMDCAEGTAPSLVVKTVEKVGPASFCKISAGDRIVCVNGRRQPAQMSNQLESVDIATVVVAPGASPPEPEAPEAPAAPAAPAGAPDAPAVPAAPAGVPDAPAVSADTTADAPPGMARAIWLWSAGSKEVNTFLDTEVDAFRRDAMGDALATVSGRTLCMESAASVFGDQDEKVAEAVRKYALAFGQDQAGAAERFDPPTALAKALAVWNWNEAKVTGWLLEDVLEGDDAQKCLPDPRIDGPTLLKQVGKIGDVAEVNAAVEDALAGQLTGFFDVMAEHLEAEAKEDWGEEG